MHLGYTDGYNPGLGEIIGRAFDKRRAEEALDNPQLAFVRQLQVMLGIYLLDNNYFQVYGDHEEVWAKLSDNRRIEIGSIPNEFGFAEVFLRSPGSIIFASIGFYGGDENSKKVVLRNVGTAPAMPVDLPVYRFLDASGATGHGIMTSDRVFLNKEFLDRERIQLCHSGPFSFFGLHKTINTNDGSQFPPLFR